MHEVADNDLDGARLLDVLETLLLGLEDEVADLVVLLPRRVAESLPCQQVVEFVEVVAELDREQAGDPHLAAEPAPRC